MLGAPIILYDHPQVAEQSPGALFDSTEIDEILTLRVMTMTEAEKAEARATDPKARAIIDRCDTMSAADLQRLHGVLHDPTFETGDMPWWDPAADAAVHPDTDAVLIDGVRGAEGQPGPGAPVAARRRTGPVLRRPGRPGDRCPRRRRRRTCTSRWCWSTTRPPTCTTGTAATSTSRPTSWSRCPGGRAGIREENRS